jgi:hypothetical protein
MLSAVAFVLGLALGVGTAFVVVADTRRRLNHERKEVGIAQFCLTQERQAVAETAAWCERQQAEVAAERDRQLGELQKRQGEFGARVIKYDDLLRENALLKHDLQNIDVNLHKLELDRDLVREKQALIDQQIRQMGARYLKDNVKWIGSSISANNFVTCKQRLQTAIGQLREIGYEIPEQQENELVSDLKAEFERAVWAELAREEQTRIKAQLREEQQLQREIDRELKQLDREREAIKVALDKALAEAKEQHTQEVERLQARLTEAEEKCQRAMSRAQMTKSGHVYVISNIGSFGEGVFKIGMSRRLEPRDRVRELGDASVPFAFDVHMMVFSTDAPKLENALHRALHKLRLNKLKPRKEFFRTDLDDIVRIVRENHGEVEYVAEPEALEYRQSQIATEDDSEFIETVYDRAEDEGADDSR